MKDNNENNFVEWDISRKISARLYYDWIKKHGLTQMMSYPETLASIFYQKRWSETSLPFVEGIFSFLSSFKILNEAGGTYSLSEYHQAKLSMIDSEIEERRINHITEKFIRYGLKIVDLKLEGDTGHWDLVQHGYLFNRGMTQKAYTSFCFEVRNYIRENLSEREEFRNFMYYSPFITCPLTKLASSLKHFDKIGFFVPTDTHKREFISYCELNKNTSPFSPYIYVDSQYQSHTKFDIIWIPTLLGFFGKIKEQVKFISDTSSKGSYQFWFTPIETQYQIGI